MKNKRTVTSVDAAALTHAIGTRGDYAHVVVRAERGHLNIYPDDFAPVARLTPLTASLYRLGFRTHTGRWEPMPFAGTLTQMAQALVDTLAPYLERNDFTDRNSGANH
jgi:hypothetical protein